MRKLIKLLAAAVALVLVWLGVVLSEWLPRTTTHQRAALEALRAQPESVNGKHNAFAALWLFAYDVPESDIEAVAAADVAAFAERAKQSPHVSDFVSTAEGKYPKLPAPINQDPDLCPPWKDGCLQHVRTNTEAARRRVAELSGRLAKGESLAKYDHHRYLFPPRVDSPIGLGFAVSDALLTATALDYVDGKVDAAFARLCRNTATWRRLRAHTDNLIVDMMGVALVANAANLYAAMLSELPADTAVRCDEVFEPLHADELNQCAAMRVEYLYQDDAVSTSTYIEMPGYFGLLPNDIAVAMINKRHARAMLAPRLAHYCQSEQAERDRLRDPTPPSAEPLCNVFAHIFDPVGCALVTEAEPDFHTYHKRVLDLDARLKLIGTVQWLRLQNSKGDRQAQFEQRPQQLRSTHHDMRFDASKRIVSMRLLVEVHGVESWSLPLQAESELTTQ